MDLNQELEIYNAAKEAYYNGSEPLMSDIEFDELERKIGLENRSYIGAKHNPSYTVKHPYIMGSLSKIQIKYGENETIEWDKYFKELKSYINRNYENPEVIVTPKYDGCSFEVHSKNGSIENISSRGDGEYGKDLKPQLVSKLKGIFEDPALKNEKEFTLRGEVLIKKSVFETKYADFVNPRSFVSGVLNRDYDQNDEKYLEMLEDLDIVIYDVRIIRDGVIYDKDWSNLQKICNVPDFYSISVLNSVQAFKVLYKDFEEYRSKCEYALDGIVFKPVEKYRENNTSNIRPKDCVAVKFPPLLKETKVVDIEWNTGKTNELRPVIIVEPVILDGKTVTRASAHNYGYLVEHKISKGTKVVLSLAGDIIPFIYKITDTSDFSFNEMNLPEKDSVWIDDMHLYKKLSEKEIKEKRFIESAEALEIPGIGPAAAKTIYDYLESSNQKDDFLGIEGKETPENILCCSSEDINNALGGKTGASAAKSFEEYKKSLTLKDIIISCTFESCGKKVAAAIQDYLLKETENFEHLAEKAWVWCKNPTSEEMQRLENIMESCGKNLEMFKQELAYAEENSIERIPVILTGEPNEYTTKDEFLRNHPEYRVTTSWKEVKIVFTNSFDSNTGKMKKAKEKGIEIRIY